MNHIQFNIHNVKPKLTDLQTSCCLSIPLVEVKPNDFDYPRINCFLTIQSLKELHQEMTNVINKYDKMEKLKKQLESDNK